MRTRDLQRRLRTLFYRSRVESELDEEVALHLDMEARKYRAQGLGPEAAMREARRAFGGVAHVKDACRDVRGTQGLEHFVQDVRFAVRLLAKDRKYALATLLTLAAGIGINTALFTVFTATALKPLPVPDPDRLVSVGRVNAQNPHPGPMPFADYLTLRDRPAVFASVAAETPNTGLHLIDSAAATAVAEPVMGLFVTANYFETFGVKPIVGRGLLPEDDRRTAAPYAALLSDNYWQQRFGSDVSVIGRTFMVGGTPTVVVGITPRDFMGTRPTVPDLWIAMPAVGDFEHRVNAGTLFSNVTARLKADATPQQAQASVSVLADSLQHAGAPGDRWRAIVAPATPFGPNHENIVKMFVVLQVAMALVLLIACSNVAGLLLSKSVTRHREIAVRLSLGATRGRLVRQLVTEGVLMAAVAGSVAYVMTWRALVLISRVVSEALAAQGGTIVVDVQPDVRVFVYLCAVSVLAGLSFALAPALQTTRPNLIAALKYEHVGFGERTGGMRAWLVMGQIAVCLALLITAGSLTAQSVRLLSIDPGFSTHDVVTMTIASPSELGYSAARIRDLRLHLDQQLRAVPGVRDVAFASRVPLNGGVTMIRASRRDDANVSSAVQAPQFPYAYVSEQYFQTLGIPFLRGRGFSAQDMIADAPVAVISDALARRLWPDGDAVGQAIVLPSRTEPGAGGPRAVPGATTIVIGTVRDVYSVNLAGPDSGAVYLPKPADEWNGTVFVRAAADPEGLTSALVHEIHRLEPRLPVSAETLQHITTTGEAARFLRVAPLVFAAIGFLGFVLAGVGVYSSVSYSVRQQTRDIGIRIALGGSPAQIIRMLLRAGVKWIAVGLALGAFVGAILSRVVARQLFAQDIIDPPVILAIAIATGALSLLAAYLPARKAAGLDPAVTLRFE